MITAVIFDLDCTITDRPLSIARFAARFVDEYALALATGVTADAVVAVISAADNAGYSSRRSVCIALNRQLPWRRPPTAAALLAFWLNTFPGCAVARSGFPELLATLRQASCRLGLISNGNGRTQRRKLQAIGAINAFDSLLISEEAGLQKPDREVFELSLRQLGVAADNAWYVGDHPLYDVNGARAAGMRAVWMAGVHPWPAELAEPEYVIHDLRELIPLIVRPATE